MSDVRVGEPVPDAELHITGDRTVRLSDYRGGPLVLYFYPKASTPGCTREGQDFAAAVGELSRRSAAVLGASRDGLKAQEGFKARQGFPFDLVSDKDESLCNLFGVIKLKNMYGKQVRGIERSTFLIDAQGVLRREWRGVKVKGHVDDVLQGVRGL
ncbi:MAG: peroxiredoxin [Chromatiales bacterium]|jgi:peroxiredoxin Q/BCP